MPILGSFIFPHPPLIIDEIGKGRQFEIKKTIDSCEEAARRITKLEPETIIVISPHSIAYSDYLHISPGKAAAGSFSDFGASNVKISVEYDSEFVRNLSEKTKNAGIPAGTKGSLTEQLDHGTMVPLYFINKYLKKYKIVRISISGLSPAMHYSFGKCISNVAEETGKKVVIVASGDLSHKLKEDGPYGFSEEGVRFDTELTNALAKGDFKSLLDFDEDFCHAAAECGLRAFIIMTGALEGKTVKPELLSYEGPFGVGYAVATFEIQNNSAKHDSGSDTGDAYVKLARQSLEHYVNTGRIMDLSDNLPDEMMSRRAGVFVSLKINGILRGCIGTIFPVRNSVAEEIVYNAISAGTEDPRFHPVGKDELPLIKYSVDVLGEAEPVKSVSELDAKRYGVIVTSKGNKRRGLLLPDLEGVDTPEEQIKIALSKAGISPDEKYIIERFEVIRHK